jgi:hypothetical protein
MKQLHFISLLLMFLIAITIRAYYINSSQFEAERQYRSAIISRVLYFEMTDSVPESRKITARVSKQRQDVLEPPVTEFVVASLYWLIGYEHLWISRLVTAGFWVTGGLFLFQLSRRLFSLVVAVCITAYYLLAPFGIVVSISFVPDPLMMMLFLLSLLNIVQYYERPSTTSLVKAAVVSGLAILVKPVCLFTVVAVFISLAIYKKETWRGVIDAKVIVFCGISILLGGSYYAYGLFVGKFLSRQAEVSMLPHLVAYPQFWKGWLVASSAAVGNTFLVGALVGMSMIGTGHRLLKGLLVGLWIGYLIFGLVFTYHIHFATHYHLQLIVIVALSFAPVIDSILNRLTHIWPETGWRLPALAAIPLIAVFSLLQVKNELAAQTRLESKEVAEEIGHTVQHSASTVYLAPYYGVPLEYYGELSGHYWPRRTSHWAFARPNDHELSVRERLRALEFSPEYFIITDFNEFNRHHADLKNFLLTNCPLLVKHDQYLIYGSCTNSSSASG